MELKGETDHWTLRVWKADSDESAPSVDTLFQSVASRYEGAVLGILLTGMGSDGGMGMEALTRAGGHTVAESAESAAVFGMPKEAIDRGAAKEILALPKIADRLVSFARGEGVRTT